jgi:hypothetical protein
MSDLRVGDFYLVEWIDSTEMKGWSFKAEVEELEPSEVQTVGILYKDELSYLTVVSSLTFANTKDECVQGIMCIPRCAIKRIKLLSYSTD